MRHYLSYVLVLQALASGASAQQQYRSVMGPAGSQFGACCIPVPDQNGDGFMDMLVGAPGWNSGRGAIYCVSGRYLTHGLGPANLWALAPPVNPGDNFGSALAVVGDVNQDGWADFLVGQPGYDRVAPAATNIGAARLVYGGAPVLASLIEGSANGSRFGASMAACGDLNQNGVADVAVGEPGWNGGVGSVSLFDGSILDQSGTVQTLDYAQITGTVSGGELGASIAGGHDLTGDGFPELLIGWPGFDGSGAPDSGRVLVRDMVNSVAWTHTSSTPGERLGSAVSFGHDYDGDGVVDIVAGAPRWSAGFVADGRVQVFSGARFVNPASPAPLELYSLRLGFSSTVFDLGLGASVLACGDLNGDGVGDILAGAPEYSVLSGFQIQNRGAMAVFSGATGTRMGLLIGSSTDRLGDALCADLGDFDGDGFADFVVAGSMSDVGGTDSGVIKACRIFAASPTTYCTGKLNSQGCTPAMAWSGTPSASSAASFTLSCTNALNQVSGIFFYSHAPNAAPFQGGTLCVKSPTRRTPISNSGGAAVGVDCTGVLSFDFNARIQSGTDATLVAGAEVFVQCWSRDSASASMTSLSNALRFLVHP
jgi:hypothetical protein